MQTLIHHKAPTEECSSELEMSLHGSNSDVSFHELNEESGDFDLPVEESQLQVGRWLLTRLKTVKNTEMCYVNMNRRTVKIVRKVAVNVMCLYGLIVMTNQKFWKQVSSNIWQSPIPADVES